MVAELFVILFNSSYKKDIFEPGNRISTKLLLRRTLRGSVIYSA